ncbi:MAG: hypothetical protein R6U41_07820 [Desulfosalsimonas sp.]|uniref:hypothetical protein n=1 Tax=Desulfosalsimonas sp. TaxID=3073848 RepID=UPI003970463E
MGRSEARRQKAALTLDAAGLSPAADFFASYPHQLSEGQIVESGPAEQVINNPGSDYTRALINAQPRFSFVNQ